MTQLIGTDKQRVVIGLGKTGYSMATWLAAQGVPFRVMDTRADAPYAAQFAAEQPQVELCLGQWATDWLNSADEVYVSPGVALAEPALVSAIAKGAQVVSDVALYARNTQAPIIAVTGSNGKSTVVTLLGAVAERLGLNAAVAGNIGKPVLDLMDESHELAILELSSFQLEMVEHLNARVAMVLNISPDHMDRYEDLAAYRLAKHRIFNGCDSLVVNADDVLTQPLMSSARPYMAYSLKRKDIGMLSADVDAAGIHVFDGLQEVIHWPTLRLKGRHNLQNILAVLAVAKLMSWPMASVAEAIAAFTGLPHRCEWVAEQHGVTFVNDSKGTNVGATVAALEGLAPECTGRLHLLLGGDSKSADFSPLAAVCQKLAVAVYTYGRDGASIADACEKAGVAAMRAETMQDALAQARGHAVAGDWVLLSPACASFDQFANFEARGAAFVQTVLGGAA
ncbi:UDP-N-acetylmuramoyl-L-alanine--D-glutamate ligase [Salinispirillum sp. LH 10-3-1]|uniref:UDP-N-acetylmuramoylalanine--D-glutamate ligase n=1 Tax=Salinispirillum sp. LH 10-3-1 TaxID=2952525 RepID=A0AB38YIF0_9GAMM